MLQTLRLHPHYTSQHCQPHTHIKQAHCLTMPMPSSSASGAAAPYMLLQPPSTPMITYELEMHPTMAASSDFISSIHQLNSNCSFNCIASANTARHTHIKCARDTSPMPHHADAQQQCQWRCRAIHAPPAALAPNEHIRAQITHQDATTMGTSFRWLLASNCFFVCITRASTASLSHTPKMPVASPCQCPAAVPAAPQHHTCSSSRPRPQ